MVTLPHSVNTGLYTIPILMYNTQMSGEDFAHILQMWGDPHGRTLSSMTTTELSADRLTSHLSVSFNN